MINGAVLIVLIVALSGSVVLNLVLIDKISHAKKIARALARSRSISAHNEQVTIQKIINNFANNYNCGKPTTKQAYRQIEN